MRQSQRGSHRARCRRCGVRAAQALNTAAVSIHEAITAHLVFLARSLADAPREAAQVGRSHVVIGDEAGEALFG